MADPAVVLVSGGLDSATVLAFAREAGHECHALSIDYGQRHRVEIEAACAVAASLDAASHTIVPLDLRVFGGSALTDSIDVPKRTNESEIEPGIPVTYVPARNLVFLSLAVAQAEVLGARSIYLGVNAVDYSGYPDCRPEFVAAFEAAANLATKAGVEGQGPAVRAPLIDLSKAEIIRRGTNLGVDFGATVSCYDPDESGQACGRCDACILRRKGFQDAGISDPTRYINA
ncbi:MAG: 7-cyano-7-deazaguanine synthase QueC [Planctomycetota bacterium]